MNNVRKDYLFKIITNLIRVPISFLLQSIFPRLLGPIQYGNFEFLNDGFTKIVTFLESGNTFAFYTRLSSNKNDYKLIKFYRILVCFTILILFLILFLICVFKFNVFLWPDQSLLSLIMICIFVALVYVSNILIRVLDSFSLTTNIEKFRIVHIILTLLIFTYFYYSNNSITINYFIFLQIIIQLILICGSLYIIYTNNKHAIFINNNLTKLNTKYYFQYFYNYSSPLFIFSVFALIFGFGDRWLLQKFGGSIQQAYFSLAQKTGSFIFIFTSAIIPLYIRENSKFYFNKEYFKMSQIYIKNVKLFMFLTIILAVIVSFNSDLILYLIGGSAFKDANNLFILMSFYPVHQTLGQINGALFYSTNRTKTYTLVGLFSLPIGFILSYFLLAPTKYFGLDLGSVGLAIQMLTIQFCNQNILLFFNCKYFNISFAKMLINQIFIILLFIIIGILISKLLHFMSINNRLNFLFIFTIILFLLSIILLIISPKIIGLDNILNFKKIKQ
jgi:O-antigen/teichoic acid export membrane protein